MTDLITNPAATMPAFCKLIADRAVKDHHAGRKTYPTGRQLCNDHADDWRIFHHKLASAIYRQVRRSIDVTGKERAEGKL